MNMTTPPTPSTTSSIAPLPRLCMHSCPAAPSMQKRPCSMYGRARHHRIFQGPSGYSCLCVVFAIDRGERHMYKLKYHWEGPALQVDQLLAKGKAMAIQTFGISSTSTPRCHQEDQSMPHSLSSPGTSTPTAGSPRIPRRCAFED